MSFYYNSCNRNCIEPYQWSINPFDYTLKSTCEKDKKTVIDSMNLKYDNLNKSCQSANEQLRRLQATTCAPQRVCPTCSCDTEKNEIVRLKSEITRLNSEIALLNSYINPVDKRNIYTITSIDNIQFISDQGAQGNTIDVQKNDKFSIIYNEEFIDGIFFLSEINGEVILKQSLNGSVNYISIGNSFYFNGKKFTFNQSNRGPNTYIITLN